MVSGRIDRGGGVLDLAYLLNPTDFTVVPARSSIKARVQAPAHLAGPQFYPQTVTTARPGDTLELAVLSAEHLFAAYALSG